MRTPDDFPRLSEETIGQPPQERGQKLAIGLLACSLDSSTYSCSDSRGSSASFTEDVLPPGGPVPNLAPKEGAEATQMEAEIPTGESVLKETATLTEPSGVSGKGKVVEDVAMGEKLKPVDDSSVPKMSVMEDSPKSAPAGVTVGTVPAQRLPNKATSGGSRKGLCLCHC